jgi:hypothetical protein
MKIIRLAIILSLVLTLLLPCRSAFADDGLAVDIDIEGDSPVVNVEADGNNPSVYINGQDIQQPTVYSYVYENDYDDTALVAELQNLAAMLKNNEVNLTTTSEGLLSVIQVLDEHTSNLRTILDYTKEAESKAVDRDNNLAIRGQEQDARILKMADTINSLLDDITEHDGSISELERTVSKQEAKIGELKSSLGTFRTIAVIVFAVILALLSFTMYRVLVKK